MIHLMGLLHVEQLNLGSYAVSAFKKCAKEGNLDAAKQFRRVIGGRRIAIDFIGVWDSISSVFVPRPDRLNFLSLEKLPHTKSNPSVKVFRQACAIDERRFMFQLYEWLPDQFFKLDRRSGPFPVQDQANVWFSGDHTDIGGGYKETESQAAKYPLIWIAKEAEDKGLILNDEMFRHLALGETLTGSHKDYVAPSFKQPLHNSRRFLWIILGEWLPRRRNEKHLFGSRNFFTSRYFTIFEPRSILYDPIVH